MAIDITDRLPLASLSSVAARPLAWALIASAAVHASFVFVHFAMRGPHQQVAATSTTLEATLVDPRPSEQIVLSSAERTPFALPASTAMVPTSPAPAEAPRARVVNPGTHARNADAGRLPIFAAPVVDRTLLGEMIDRQLRDFPAEIDSLPRPDGKISVFYPPTALAAGREETVAVWFIVSAAGQAEEITVTQGSEDFAAVVTAALQNAQFVPARNNLTPIAFPLSLEFRFALDAASPDTATAATKPPQ